MHLRRILAVETRRDVTAATGHVDQRHCVQRTLVDVRTPDGTAAARRYCVAGELAGKAFGERRFVEEQLVEAIVVAGAAAGAGAGRVDAVAVPRVGSVETGRQATAVRNV